MNIIDFWDTDPVYYFISLLYKVSYIAYLGGVAKKEIPVVNGVKNDLVHQRCEAMERKDHHRKNEDDG